MDNVWEIKKITLYKKIHCYCRLGGDWYTNQLTISFDPIDEVPDYVLIDEKIESYCEKKDLIIEEVVFKIKNIILELCPSAKNISVVSYVDDSVPKNMFVKVEI